MHSFSRSKAPTAAFGNEGVRRIVERQESENSLTDSGDCNILFRPQPNSVKLILQRQLPPSTTNEPSAHD